MKRVIVLGATGMLGYAVYDKLKTPPRNNEFQTYGTISSKRWVTEPGATKARLVFGDDKPIVFDVGDSFSTLLDFAPDVIINCIGAIPQNNHSLKVMEEVNSFFPIQLAHMTEQNNIRLICISTDCVFSGVKGFYSEKDATDCITTYGKTKELGEIKNRDNVLTLRTSFYGPEIFNKNSLYEWVISKRGQKIKGFKNFIFSGMSTVLLAGVLKHLLNYDLSGLYHIGLAPYSKYRLIQEINKQLNLNITIEPEYTTSYNKSLNCEKLIEDYKQEWFSDTPLDEAVFYLKYWHQEKAKLGIFS